MVTRINCNSDQTFQVDLRVPSSTTGSLVTPSAGAVTGIKARISASRFGAAIHATVNDLACSERSGKPGRFYVDVDQALMQARVLPLGSGERFYVIYSKSGDFDMKSMEYEVAEGD